MNSEMHYEEIKLVHQAMNAMIRMGNVRDVAKCVERLKLLFDKRYIRIPDIPVSSVYIIHDNDGRKGLKESVIPLIYDSGFAVYSSWIWRNTADEGTPGYNAFNECMINVRDLADSDLVLMFANQYGSRPDRKKFIEFGMSLALGKKVVVTGGMEDRLCMYYHHPGVTYVRASEGLGALVDRLNRLRRGEKVRGWEAETAKAEDLEPRYKVGDILLYEGGEWEVIELLKDSSGFGYELKNENVTTAVPEYLILGKKKV